ncbi:MAG: helix-turn-helix domain-containing protein [Nitrosotalea sp.]|jgi:predicted transcriptional regulator
MAKFVSALVSVNIDNVEEKLVSELRLSPMQAKVFVLVVKEGKKSAKDVAQSLSISDSQASEVTKSLVDLGGFIDITKTEFESMHPRFAVVNMYRRMCLRENIPFKKNLLVDNISIVLEKPYDDARTK